MRKKLWIRIATLFVISCLVFTVSCRKKIEPPPPEPAPVIEDTTADDERAAREAAEAERLRLLEEEQLAAEAAKESFLNDVVYFEFDSAVVDGEGQGLLNAKAEWLNNNPDIAVIIEGHCDKKGTNAYNLALGDRRANSVKSYMVDLGVSASRMTTISYGEERPVDPGDDAKNRRARFVIE